MFESITRNSSVFQKDHFRLLFRIDSSQNHSKNFIDRSLCFDYRIRFGFREAFVPEIDEAQIAIPFDFWILVANAIFFTKVVSVYWHQIIALFQPSVVLVVPARTSSPASGPMASPRRSSIGVPSHRSKLYSGPIIYLLQTLAYTLRPF